MERGANKKRGELKDRKMRKRDRWEAGAVGKTVRKGSDGRIERMGQTERNGEREKRNEGV